jgi:mono/diheme cytochrome c family protein
MKSIVTAFLVLFALAFLASCSSSAAPSSSSQPGASSSSPVASTTSSDSSTYGQFAGAGATVFAAHCAKCHGDNGQGVTAPTLIGSGAQLGKYSNSQGLLNFYKLAMPFDAPGSLSSQDYLNILAFLMVQNGYVSSTASYDSNALLNIQLK